MTKPKHFRLVHPGEDKEQTPVPPDLPTSLLDKEREIRLLRAELTALRYLNQVWHQQAEAAAKTEAAMRVVEQALYAERAAREQVEQSLRAQLHVATSGLAWRLVQALRRYRRMIAPHASRRERLFFLLKRTARVWRHEGLAAVRHRAVRKLWRKGRMSLGRLHQMLQQRLSRQTGSGHKAAGDHADQVVPPALSVEVSPFLPVVTPTPPAPELTALPAPVSIPTPTVQDLAVLAEILAHSPRAMTTAEKPVDVIIPVYKGLSETLRCLRSLLAAPTTAPHEITVINDTSPDPFLVGCLHKIAAAGLIRLLENPLNLGFVKTANRGMALHPDRDVILLNADTEVCGDWLDRLAQAAYSAPNVGSVTPLSNNATICSYPHFCQDNAIPADVTAAELDHHCATYNAGEAVDVPTGVGFCMYIRRECLNAVGLFNEEHFGKGYGEENDFCMRARQRGWRHLLTTDTFVHHVGGVAFGATKHPAIQQALQVLNTLHPDYNHLVGSHVQADAAQPYRRRIDLARLAGPQPAMLYITHHLGGGTERHVLDMATRLEAEGFRALILRPVDASRVRIERLGIKETPNLVFEVPGEYWTLRAALRDLSVVHAHVHHAISLPRQVLALIRDLGIPYDWTVHDYFTICPRINLVDETGTYCGEPGADRCNVCLERNGSHVGGKIDIRDWRREFGFWLGHARRVIVPNRDVALRLARYFPDVEFTVRLHFEAQARARSVAAPLVPGEPLRVAVIGTIHLHKGSPILLGCAHDALARNLPLRFHVVGCTDRDEVFRALPNVSITGAYREEEVFDLLESLRCHCAFFPASWPETYSYTLSIAIMGKIFPVAFDLGAPADRIRAWGVGHLIPLTQDARRINNELLSVAGRLAEPLPDPWAEFRKYPALIADYYGLEHRDAA